MPQPAEEGLVAGIDGGGTLTRAVLVTPDGSLRGRGKAGPGNPHAVGEEEAARHVLEALRRAIGEVRRERRRLVAVCVACAGVATHEERERLARALRAQDPGLPDRLLVDHDLRAAHAGAFAGQAGIVLVVGTGSACLGADAGGRTARAGGLGPFLDDGGSAWFLGWEALRACLRARDGRAPGTALAQALADVLARIDPRAPGLGLTTREVAGLAPLVTETAVSGDAAARAIIAAGCDELAACVEAVAHRLGMEAPEVALVGGLRAAGPVFSVPLSAAILGRLPHARLREPELPPALGAALLTLREPGCAPDAALVARLRRAAQGSLDR